MRKIKVILAFVFVIVIPFILWSDAILSAIGNHYERFKKSFHIDSPHVVDKTKVEFKSKKQMADKLFPEVVTNLQKIDSVLNDFKNDTLKSLPLFYSEKYTENYSSFSIGALDRQIENYYNSLKNATLERNQQGWNMTRGMGDDIKRKLEKYFCCKENIQYIKANVATQDTIVLVGSIPASSETVMTGVTAGIYWGNCYVNYLEALNIESNQ